MSVHQYTRSLVEGQWDCSPRSLSPHVASSFPGKAFWVRASGANVSIAFSDDLTPGEVTTLDGVVSSCIAAFSPLPVVKQAKIACIDARTDELIAEGFVYQGKQFSLSLPSQAKMMGTHQVRNDSQLVYPIKWNNIDDTDYYNIQNPADLDGFYFTGLGTVRAHLDSGSDLKDLVNQATTVAEVEAVVDPR